MIGIGGVGMSALAQLFVSRGNVVSGSDRGTSPTTELLEKKGVVVAIGQHAENVPEGVDMVVYSDAVPEDNPERVYAREHGICEVSYFKALGEVSHGMRSVAVAGTHGKTTTTALLTKILKDGGENPTAIIGSLVPEFGSNFVQGGELFVVEACEYHDHLLELSPEVLVITNLEWDHTDWFKTFEDMQSVFRKAIERVPENGVIVTDPQDSNIAPLLVAAKAKVVDYTKEVVPELQLIGSFNEMNARAAKAAAKCVAQVSEEVSSVALSQFKGTWRRFEKKGETETGAVVYDDYAHHPTAIRETLEAVRAKFREERIVVAFHPHLYSRTHDLMDEFAGSFGAADEVVVAPIYAAREEPISGVTAETLAEKIMEKGVRAVGVETLEEVFEKLKALDSENTVIITMGAGDVYTVAEQLVAKV